MKRKFFTLAAALIATVGMQAETQSLAVGDVTTVIANPSFDNSNADGWSGSAPGFDTKSSPLPCNAEFFNTNFDFYQTLENLPAGVYKLSVQGFYRPGEKAYTDTENRNAKLYATQDEQTVMSALLPIYAGVSESSLGGNEASTTGGYIPANMLATYYYFEAQKYTDNSLMLYVAEDGTAITVGLKKETTIYRDWTIFDNWGLYFYGNEDIDAFKEYVSFMKKEAYYPDYSAQQDECDADIYNAYTAALGNLENITDMSTAASLIAAYNTAHDNLKANLTVYASYKSLKELIEICEQYTNNSSAEDDVKTAFSNAVASARNTLTSATESSVLESAFQNLEEARQEYALAAQPTNESYFDMTFLISSQISEDGWSGKYGLIPGHNTGSDEPDSESFDGSFIEQWQKTNASTEKCIYQAISNVPVGLYEFTAAVIGVRQSGGNQASDATLYCGSGCSETIAATTMTYGTAKGYSNGDILEIGVSCTGLSNWLAMGYESWTLKYYGNDNQTALTDGQEFNATTSYTAETMSYAREFTKDTWLTICLPFAYTLPKGVVAEELTSMKDGVFTFAAVDALEANKPYIIKNTTETATLFAELINVEVKATPESMTTVVEGATMAGTYKNVKATELVADYDVLFFNTAGELKYLDAANTAAVEKITFTPFRAYILVDKGTFDDSTAQTIAVRHGEGTTGIGNVIIEPENAEIIYDLMGRRAMKIEKGIYILNGKKVVR